MKYLGQIILSILVCAAAQAEIDVNTPLEAYKNAFNSNNPNLLVPYLSDSFRYYDIEVPVSFDVIKGEISLSPYKIVSFDNTETEPRGKHTLIETDATISVANISDTMHLMFLMTEQQGMTRIAAILETDEDEPISTTESPVAVSFPIMVRGGQVFISVEFRDGFNGDMIVHSILQGSTISPEFAEQTGISDGIVPYMAIGGIVRKKYPVQLSELNIETVDANSVIGVLGADFFSGYAILLDMYENKITLISCDEKGDLLVPLERFGVFVEPSDRISLLGAYPFTAISADLGYGFEAPMALDFSTSGVVFFADFFRDLPEMLIDEEGKRGVMENIGKTYTSKYIAIGKSRTESVTANISSEKKLCNYEFPSGIAGIIGVSFFGNSVILLNAQQQVIWIFK